MFNILISKTDPYSFMELVKATSTGRRNVSPMWRLINAGLVSILLIVAITRMAQGNAEAGQVDSTLNTPVMSSYALNQATACRLKACYMV